MKTNAKSLTEGKPMALILTFAFPIFAGRLFQMIYSLVDTKIVGSVIGSSALAAVGSVSILYNLINGFLSGLTLGFSVVCAQSFGRGDLERVRKNVAGTVVLGFLSAFLIVGVTVVLLKPILGWMQVPPEQFEMAYDYILVLLCGMFATLAYNICADVLRAIGDSVTPLFFLIIASVLNVILDYFFVSGLHFGVAGAAYATVLAQCLSAVLCLLYIRKHYTILHLKKSDFRIEKEMVSTLFQNGIAMGLMSCLVNFGTLILQTGVNGLGETVIVAHTAARKIFEIFCLPVSVLGASMATYCGQNFGAGKYGRIKSGMKAVLGIGLCFYVVGVFLSFPVSAHLVGFVASTSDSEVLYWGSTYLKCNMSFQAVCVLIVILRNSMQGFGDQKTPVVSSFIELVAKIVFTFIFVKQFGYWGVIWTEPVAWILMVIPLIVMTLKNPVMEKSLAGKK